MPLIRIIPAMKKLSFSLAALAVMTLSSLAGNLGPGPWANGAYFPGQFDGVYSASAFGSNGISGVIGFGLRNGSPTVSTNSVVSSNAVQNTISLDPFQNYFVVFVDGITYAGYTLASINVDSSQVTGALYAGVGPGEIRSFTNAGVVTFQEFARTCSGGFTAKLTGKKAVVTFKGDETGTLSTAINGAPDTTNSFSVNGIKVSNDPTSPASPTTAASN